MDFRLTEEQLELRSAASDAFARWTARDAASSGDESFATLAAEGWAGLTFPEGAGGAGLGLLEQVLALEAAGYHLNAAYGPFLTLGSIPLARTGL